MPCPSRRSRGRPPRPRPARRRAVGAGPRAAAQAARRDPAALRRRPLARRDRRRARLQRGGRAALAARGPQEAARGGGGMSPSPSAPHSIATPPQPRPLASPSSPSPTSPTRCRHARRPGPRGEQQARPRVPAYVDHHGGVDEVLEHLSAGLSPRILEAPGAPRRGAPRARRVLRGRRHGFDLPIDLALIKTPFAKRLLQATARIPFGETRTYRDMATAAGNPLRRARRRQRARPQPDPDRRALPPRAAHGRRIGGYTGGLDRKVKLLATEGIEIP